MKTNGDREMDEGAELPERVQLEMNIMRRRRGGLNQKQRLIRQEAETREVK